MRYVLVPITAETSKEIPQLRNYDNLTLYVKDLWDYYNKEHFDSSLYPVDFILLNDCDRFLVKYCASDHIEYGEFIIRGERIYFSPKIMEAEDLFRQVLLREMYNQANNESNYYIAPNYSENSDSSSQENSSNTLQEHELDFINFHTNKTHIVPYNRLRVGVCYNTFVWDQDTGEIKKVTCRIVHKEGKYIYFVYYDEIRRKDILHKIKYGKIPFIYAGKRQRKRLRGKIPISLVKRYQEKAISNESN